MKSDRTNAFLGLTVIAGFLLVIFVVVPSACTDPAGTRRVLTQQGYTNIETTGYRFFGGDKSDVYATGFAATAPNGDRVTGCVTSGIFKGNTVRLD